MWNSHEIPKVLWELVILAPHLPPWFEFTTFGVRYFNFI